MMNPTAARVVFLTLLAILPSISLAQDVDDHQGVSTILGAGARAWGMGGAFIALADDATAASWNPAGLAQLRKPEMSAVTDLNKGNIEWRYRYETNLDRQSVVDESVGDLGQTYASGLAFASGTYPFHRTGRPIVAQLSYRRLSTFPGILNPYRTRSTSVDSADGSVSSSETANIYTTSYSGGFDSYSVSGATSLFRERLKVGVTANYIRADVSTTSVLASTDGSGSGSQSADLGLSYSFSGVTFDLGVLYSPVEKLSLAAVYHTGFRSPLWYHSTLETRATQRQETGGRANIRWPKGLGAGVALKPTPYLIISADAAITHWSEGKVDAMQIATLTYGAEGGWLPEFVELKALGFPYFGCEQRDTRNIRAGVEYVTFQRGIAIPLRLGGFREQQAVNAWDAVGDAQPQPKYFGYTAGIGIAVGKMQVDLAYVRTTGLDRGRSGQVDDTTTAVFETTHIRNQRVILSTILRF